jgi:hypothetical protein
VVVLAAARGDPRGWVGIERGWVLRLVALGTPHPILRRAAVGNWRFSRRTGVRYGGRDVSFPSRTRQIKRVPGCALRPVWPHLASGGLSSTPSHREEERREKKLGATKRRWVAASRRRRAAAPHLHGPSLIRRRPELLPELELAVAGRIRRRARPPAGAREGERPRLSTRRPAPHLTPPPGRSGGSAVDWDKGWRTAPSIASGRPPLASASLAVQRRHGGGEPSGGERSGTARGEVAAISSSPLL